MSDFKGKSAIVTGSTSGIGEATAILLASKGAKVTLCGRDKVRLQDAAGKCRRAAAKAGYSSSYVAVSGDLLDSTVREKLIDKTVKAFGRLDILIVNHGGVFEGDSFTDMSEEAFDKTFATNLSSALFLIQAAVPHLEKTNGSVVVVSSFLTRRSVSQTPIYQMSKAALDQMVRCLALEHGPRGIRVNCVCPTFVRTRLLDEQFPASVLSQLELMFEQETPLNDAHSGTEEQAEVIAYLASGDAKFISGESLLVDGGLLTKGNPANFKMGQ